MDDLTRELVTTLELAVRYLEHPDVAAMDFAHPVANVTERAKAAIQRAHEPAAQEVQRPESFK